MDDKIDNSDNSVKRYYINNKIKIMKQFNSLIKAAEKVNLPFYSESNFQIIREKARIEFESLLSRLPYVGGDKAPFTALMIQSAGTIAFYRATKSLNLSEREVGKMIYKIAESYAQSFSSVKKWLYRRALFSKKMKNHWREWLKESQKLEYPENWIGNFIESDGMTFDWGFNFTECGWMKLIHNEGVEKIAPYACLCDYARMQAIGVGFKRTKTIATGAEICDFRFLKNYQTPRGWPPESLEENKGFHVKNIFTKR